MDRERKEDLVLGAQQNTVFVMRDEYSAVAVTVSLKAPLCLCSGIKM